MLSRWCFLPVTATVLLVGAARAASLDVLPAQHAEPRQLQAAAAVQGQPAPVIPQAPRPPPGVVQPQPVGGQKKVPQNVVGLPPQPVEPQPVQQGQRQQQQPPQPPQQPQQQPPQQQQYAAPPAAPEYAAPPQQYAGQQYAGQQQYASGNQVPPAEQYYQPPPAEGASVPPAAQYAQAAPYEQYGQGAPPAGQYGVPPQMPPGGYGVPPPQGYGNGQYAQPPPAPYGQPPAAARQQQGGMQPPLPHQVGAPMNAYPGNIHYEHVPPPPPMPGVPGAPVMHPSNVTSDHIAAEWDRVMENFIPDMIVTFRLQGGEGEYFHIDVDKKGTVIRGGFFESSEASVAKTSSSTFTVVSPGGQIVYSSKTGEGLFMIEAKQVGTYTFGIMGTTWSGRKFVTLVLGSGTVNQITADEVSTVDGRVKSLYTHLGAVENQAAWLWAREKSALQAVNSTANRTYIILLAEIICTVIATAVSVLAIKSSIARRNPY